jgi:predicted cupin superfamily sugar epimerase
MPHYYFHVRRGQITILDHEGIELADTVGAEVEAEQRAQQVMDGEAMNGASMNEASASRGGIIVADDTWQTLFEFPF